MSEPVRLLVLFVDEVSENAWRGPLEAAARADQWDVLTGTVADWAKMTDRCIVLSTDPDWGIVIPASHSVVLFGGTPVPPPGPLFSKETKELLVNASARLCKAAAIVTSGGLLIDAASLSLAIPIIGEVARADVPTTRPQSDKSSLSIYENLTPKPGASAIWPATGFWYNSGDALDGGQSDLDLTGRGRIIVNGPHLYLTPGVWRATLEVTVDPEGGASPLRFDWAHGDSKVSCDAIIQQPGRYRIELSRRWEVGGPAQIVVVLTKPLFQGRFEMHDCTVELTCL